MANYIGNQPSAGEFKHLDSITSQFNGSSVTFALKFNAVSQSIGDASQLIVSLNGVIQEPLTAYTLGTGGSTITFASAPQSGDTCFIVMLGGVGGTATPTDNSVTTAKIVDGAVTSSKISIDGDISFPDNDKLILGTGSDLQIYHDGTNSQLSTLTGQLFLGSVNSNTWVKGGEAGILNAAGTEYMIRATSNGSVKLFYDNVQKFATSSTGVDVTGITKSTTGFQFGSTTSYLYESATDVATLRVGSNGPYMRLGSDDGEIGNSSGSTRFIAGTGGAKILLDTNGKVGIGVDNFSVFNGVGGNSMLVVKGSNTATNIVNNSNASITIANDDGTANNTAGLHFARADTDDNPHYAGASIVTQFTQAQVTGQYPKADLAFLTSTDANYAPSEKMRISASGNVGIGTTNPTFTADVTHQNTGETDVMRLKGHAGNSFIRFQDGDNSGDWTLGADDGSGGGSGLFIVYDRNATAYRMIINSTGQVGMGTVSPGARLHIYDNTQGRMALENSSRRIDLIGDGSGFTVRDQSAAANRFRIDTDGRFGFGGDPNTSRKVYIYGSDTTSTGNVLGVRNANSTAGAFINFLGGGGNAPSIGAKGNDLHFTEDNNNGTQLMRLEEGGVLVHPQEMRYINDYGITRFHNSTGVSSSNTAVFTVTKTGYAYYLMGDIKIMLVDTGSPWGVYYRTYNLAGRASTFLSGNSMNMQTTTAQTTSTIDYTPNISFVDTRTSGQTAGTWEIMVNTGSGGTASVKVIFDGYISGCTLS